MCSPPTKVSLPEPQRKLVELMQEINHGRIEGLAVRGGNPVLEPRPRVIREIKFCAENGPRAERKIPDYCLKAPVIECLRYLQQVRDGTIETLDVKHGLPFRMTVAEPTS